MEGPKQVSINASPYSWAVFWFEGEFKGGAYVYGI